MEDSQRNKKGQFVKGNSIKHEKIKKRQIAKAVMSEMEKLQAEIYNESLRQILEALNQGELTTREVISVMGNIGDFITPKKTSKDAKGKVQKLDLNKFKALLDD
jgi:ATP-dependent Lon protease